MVGVDHAYGPLVSFTSLQLSRRSVRRCLIDHGESGSHPVLDDTDHNVWRYCLQRSYWFALDCAYVTLQIEAPCSDILTLLCTEKRLFVSDRETDPAPHRLQDMLPLGDYISTEYTKELHTLFKSALEVYCRLVSNGVDDRRARLVLPQGMPMRVKVQTTMRTWVQFINRYTPDGTDASICAMVEACRTQLLEHVPSCARLTRWSASDRDKEQRRHERDRRRAERDQRRSERAQRRVERSSRRMATVE